MIRRGMPIRWSLSAIFLIAVLLPTAAVLVTAGIGIVHHDRAMKRVMASYVENLADNVASRVDLEDSKWVLPTPMVELLRQLQVFSWGPSLPGWVVVVDGDGKILLASPGAEVTFKRLWRKDVPIGRAVELMDDRGDRYTVAVYPAASTFVVAAVAWNQLMGPMVQASRLWSILIGAVVVASVISGVMLWRWAIGPIKGLSDELADLKWGCEVPLAEDSRNTIWEVRHLRTVLCRLSRAAREKVELWNRYLQDVVRVQENEKSRIARDIHDGPVQEVTALIQRIRLASLDPVEKREDHLRLAEDIGKETIRQLREMCNQLSPPWLDLGMKHALDELSDRLSRHLGLFVQLDISDDVEEDPDVILAFFRIIQEAIHNSSRHGGAKNVDIEISGDEENTYLSIKDDGSGFQWPEDFELLRSTGHRGLLNMRERIELIGGSMRAETSPGEGCSLFFTVPVIGRT